jgi:hypothetical protein
MDKKTKELHYKSSKLTGAKGTLQKWLEEVVTKHVPLPEKRLERLGLNSDEGRVFLDPRHHQAVLCLTMSTYVQGTLQPIMGMAPKAASWPIRQVHPPKLPDTEQTEFLDGYLFLGVWKNHVVFMPTRSLGSEELEDHLLWLLRHHPHWPEKAVVHLNDRSPEEYRQRKFKHVQVFKMESPLEAKPVKQKATTAKTQTIHFQPAGATWEGLKSFISQLGGTLPEDSLQLDSFDPNDIHVKVEVTCRKKALERSGPVLDMLANSLRHVTTDVVRMKFDDGTELKGSELKTRHPVRVECAGNMPVPTQVDRAIHDYLHELANKGTISTDE